jgi:hypothetical protein
MMDNHILERRRLLQLFMLGSLAAPAVALAGCATGSGRRTRPPQFGGGSSDKHGNNGGPGAQGSR